MDHQLDISSGQQSRQFGHYIDSNPSSTHSSPRTYPADLDPYYPPTQHSGLVHSQTYPIPAGVSVHPYLPAQQRRPHPAQNSRSSSYSSYPGPVPLQVSTSTSSAHEHDPNERTARPGNAHVHAQFHSQLTASIAQAASSSTASASTSNASQSGTSSVNVARNHSTDGGDGDGDGAGQRQEAYVSSTPGVQMGLSRALKPIEQERLAHLDRLKFFLATAPSRWDSAAANANPTGITSSGGPGEDFGAPYSSAMGGYGAGGGFSGMGLGLEPAYHHAPPHPALNRFLLPNQEFVTCVLWNGLYHITGTDIVRALVFRFEAFGRPVKNMKKFEEGVFSDLRNLKPGVDACLEEPKSPFLDLLFKYQCIRTQKKQKVFYWFSVPHDRLFLDALERDLKREKMGLEPTTQIVGEPALSFTYDPKRSLYEQFSKAQGAREGEGELETAIRIAERSKDAESTDGDSAMDESDASEVDDAMNGDDEGRRRPSTGATALQGPQFLNLFTLFEGSPTYKQRRKKGTKSSALSKSGDEYGDEYDRGRSMDPSSTRYSSQSRERRHLPPPRHPSMMDEFGPNSEQTNTSEAMSAADMFLKQARGELVPADGVVRKPKPQPIVGDVGVFYSEGAPSDQQQSGHARGRSFDMAREGPVPRPPGSMSAGYAASTFAEAGQQQQLAHPSQMATGMAQYEAVSEDGKVRAFVCPLYSCGRLFKRMEHLKRHLRTHTMERPFTCNRCNKKFSRSDNLTQHLRTHERTGHGSLPGNSGGNEWMDGADDADASGTESANEGGSVADSDDDGGLHGMTNFHQMGGLEMFGDGMMSMDFAMLEGGGFPMGNLDAQMCEVEVPGGVRDVPGDEDGLLMPTAGVPQPSGSDSYFSSLGSSAPSSGMLFSSNSEFTDSAQWIDHPQPSPGFNAISAPLRPTVRSVQGHHSHSSTSSTSSAFGDEYSNASLSAPSHKQSFDHSALYPPGMMDGVGPTRRHRSMTPSLVRNGEPIRRPMTSSSNEFPGATSGSPASLSSSIGSSRGYHPYAYSGSNSRANSTHNSPQVHPVPLGPDYAPTRRSDSRSSNYSTGGLNDQMRQMMSMDPSTIVDTMFRSDSPASFHQTESPAAFNMDLPLQYSATGTFMPQPQPLHASTMPTQYTQQQQQQFEGYYSQTHTTL